MTKSSVHYNRKNHWKLGLFISAAVVFAFFIYASNVLLNRIADEERKKVQIWANAVSRKAELVNYTEYFFDNIKMEEGKRAALLVKAMQKANEASFDEDITFYIDIISSNSTIPFILAKENGDIDYCDNVDSIVKTMHNVAELGDRINEYGSIKIPYYKNNYKRVYYKESQIYAQLHLILDDLIKSFFQEVVINNASVPVIITDSTKEHILTYGNIDSNFIQRKNFSWERLLHKMESQNEPLCINLAQQGACYVFYEESSVLRRLRFFPLIEFGIIAVFCIVGYLFFSFARRSEQNQVWVGMSKETAHQLGTPISSLMAWTEILKEQEVDNEIIREMDKDVKRLDVIAQRFSKIGSVPELKTENLIATVADFVVYLQSRLSKKITIVFNQAADPELPVNINKYLFEWVIENLCKNAVDAIEGEGTITLNLTQDEKHIYLDVTDSGKGMTPKQQKNIFKPGYTSKKRGWGLGLTLAKRIMEEYHKGKLAVLSSMLGKGTTMRITLRKK